mmetsp:Transcript_37384/g.116876  ORF Transcript_37384/g.116876 Transcript_37384/m.116876 type:complete len:109 (-) Transcript_37384:1438-1764(-)
MYSFVTNAETHVLKPLANSNDPQIKDMSETLGGGDKHDVVSRSTIYFRKLILVASYFVIGPVLFRLFGEERDCYDQPDVRATKNDMRAMRLTLTLISSSGTLTLTQTL